MDHNGNTLENGLNRLEVNVGILSVKFGFQ